MRVLLVVTIALLLNISLHRCNRFSPNYAEKCPTFTQKNSDVLPRISEISPKMSENFFEFSDCFGAQSPISPSLALFSPRLFCLSPSPPYALLLPNYDPNWGIMGKFPISFEPFKGEVVLYCNVNCLIKVITIAPFIIFEGG